MNITGMLPLFLEAKSDLETHVSGGQIMHVYVVIDRLGALRMREKTGTGLQV